jgi:hypothetical protein
MFRAGDVPFEIEPVTRTTKGSRVKSLTRRLAAPTVAGSVLLLTTLAAAPAAHAADPQVNHFRDVFSEVDPDFCGTGQEIDIAFDIRVTEWLAPHQADFKNTTTGKVTFTNPVTGDTVIQLFAGPFWAETISGDPDGLHIDEFTAKGLPELFKTPHGGVLTLDAGYIVFHVTFDGDEFISSEIVVNNGPHPQADSDFELFCEIMPEALGL